MGYIYPIDFIKIQSLLTVIYPYMLPNGLLCILIIKLYHIILINK